MTDIFSPLLHARETCLSYVMMVTIMINHDDSGDDSGDVDDDDSGVE